MSFNGCVMRQRPQRISATAGTVQLDVESGKDSSAIQYAQLLGRQGRVCVLNDKNI